MEIVAISLVKAHMNINIESIYTIFKDMGIDEDTLKNQMNIEKIDDREDGVFLIFTLIPNAERYDPEERLDRYTVILKLLQAA